MGQCTMISKREHYRDGHNEVRWFLFGIDQGHNGPALTLLPQKIPNTLVEFITVTCKKTKKEKKRYPTINRNFLWKINLSKMNVV